MKTYDDLEARWRLCNGGQILVDASHPLKMYLNVNEEGHRELLIPVRSSITNFQSTEAIDVKNYKSGNNIFFAIELLNENLSREYTYLCFDLIESSRKESKTDDALKALIVTFKKWYAIMNRVRRDILPEEELRGLMGELKFAIDSICAGRNPEEVIGAWTIHKDAARDFIFDNDWYEIKTVASSKDYITISSVEQLQHDCDGHLMIYRLDKCETGNGININNLVEQLREMLDSDVESILNRVLLSKGYVTNDAYGKYVYVFSNEQKYIVNDTFPRIARESIPDAIIAARYDINIRSIADWRVE